MITWFDYLFPRTRRRRRRGWEVQERLKREMRETEAKVIKIRGIVDSINARLGRALGEPGARPGNLRRGLEDMAKTLDEALESVRSASTRTDSIIADRKELKAQLEEALKNAGTITPAQQAAIDEIFDIETSDAKKIDDALNTGVEPPAPSPGPAPEPTPAAAPIKR
jgi:chromosome segregation ATPase